MTTDQVKYNIGRKQLPLLRPSLSAPNELKQQIKGEEGGNEATRDYSSK